MSLNRRLPLSDAPLRSAGHCLPGPLYPERLLPRACPCEHASASARFARDRLPRSCLRSAAPCPGTSSAVSRFHVTHGFRERHAIYPALGIGCMSMPRLPHAHHPARQRVGWFRQAMPPWSDRRISSTAASSRQKAPKTSFCNPPIRFSEDEYPRRVLLITRIDSRRRAFPDRSVSRESTRGERATLLISRRHCPPTGARPPHPPTSRHRRRLPSPPEGGLPFGVGQGSVTKRTRDGSCSLRTQDASIDRAPRQGVPRPTPLPESPGSQRRSPNGGLPFG